MGAKDEGWEQVGGMGGVGGRIGRVEEREEGERDRPGRKEWGWRGKSWDNCHLNRS